MNKLVGGTIILFVSLIVGFTLALNAICDMIELTMPTEPQSVSVELRKVNNE